MPIAPEPLERGELPGRVREGAASHGRVSEEDSERAEQHSARPRVEPRVHVLAVHEGRRAEGYVREPRGAKGTLVRLDRVRDALGPVVHDDGEQAVAVGGAAASRLVDEDAGFPHCSPGNEKAGENVPGTWKPSYGGKPTLYHGSSGNSRALESIFPLDDTARTQSRGGLPPLALEGPRQPTGVPLAMILGRAEGRAAYPLHTPGVEPLLAGAADPEPGNLGDLDRKGPKRRRRPHRTVFPGAPSSTPCPRRRRAGPGPRQRRAPRDAGVEDSRRDAFGRARIPTPGAMVAQLRPGSPRRLKAGGEVGQ